MGVGVAEHVRMDATRDPGLEAPVTDEFRQPRLRQPALLADPQGGQIGPWVLGPGPQVSIEGADGLCANRHDPRPAPLAGHSK